MLHSRTVGPYALVRQLGRGSSGVVWEAVQRESHGLERRVALKILHHRGGIPDAAGRAEMLRAARFGMRLSHPNVVETLELGESEGTWFLAMEYVDGIAASELVDGPLPPAAVVELGCQVCAALAHVHALRTPEAPDGLVHCDVKPANLLVDHTGLVKLADLGTAQLTGARSGVIGTPGFMAPEQASGRPEPRSDLFGLGAVLVTLATGTPAFPTGHERAPTVTEVERALADPAWVRRLDDCVPGLGAIAGRCLRGRPGARFANARTAAEALRTLARSAQPGPSLAELVGAARHRGAAVASAATVRRTSVPAAPSDPLVGRAAELRDVADGVASGDPLWVLLGPGGVGKSRLAREVVSAGAADDACWVDLAHATAPTAARAEELLCAGLADALRLRTARDPVDQIGRALRHRGALLVVLDGIEGLRSACAQTLGRWLGAAPNVRWLVTSRVALHIPGAEVRTLEPLSAADGATLLLDRAATGVSRADAERISVALQGLPLALEIAAAQLAEHSTEAVLAQLASAAHPGLEASLSASWALLPDRERSALCQLSVFAGTFTTEAATAVVELDGRADPASLWEVVASLLDHSLLHYDPDSARFSMLDSVQSFAAARLEPELAARTEHAHARVMAELGAPQALAALRGHGGRSQGKRLAAERANLALAARRAAARGAPEVSVSAALAAAAAYRLRGPAHEGVQLLTEVIDAGSGPRTSELLRARAALQRTTTSATADLERARAIATADERPDLLAGVLVDLADVHSSAGRTSDAAACAYEAHALLDRAEQPCLRADLLSARALRLGSSGDRDRAQRDNDLALVLYRQEGDLEGEARSLGHAGVLAAYAGRPDEAVERIERAIELYTEESDERGRADAWSNLAWVNQRAGRWGPAVAALDRALELDTRAGRLKSVAQSRHSRALALLRMGRPDEALAEVELGVAAARELGSPLALLEIGNIHAEALLARGRVDEAIARAEVSLREAEGAVDNPLALGCARATLGQCLLERDPEAARAALDAATRTLASQGAAQAWASTRALAALASARTGRFAEGWAALREAEERLRERPGLGTGEVRAYLERARSELSAVGTIDPDAD